MDWLGQGAWGPGGLGVWALPPSSLDPESSFSVLGTTCCLDKPRERDIKYSWLWIPQLTEIKGLSGIRFKASSCEVGAGVPLLQTGDTALHSSI